MVTTHRGTPTLPPAVPSGPTTYPLASLVGDDKLYLNYMTSWYAELIAPLAGELPLDILTDAAGLTFAQSNAPAFKMYVDDEINLIDVSAAAKYASGYTDQTYNGPLKPIIANLVAWKKANDPHRQHQK